MGWDPKLNLSLWLWISGVAPFWLLTLGVAPYGQSLAIARQTNLAAKLGVAPFLAIPEEEEAHRGNLVLQAPQAVLRRCIPYRGFLAVVAWARAAAGTQV